MKGYKGFNKQLQCAPEGKVFQYELGKDFKHGGNLSLCNSGFHFCENPLDVLRYYQPCTSRYAEVNADDVAESRDKDSKRVASTLHIGAELSLSALIGLGIKFVIDRTKSTPTSGDSSSAATSGYYSHAATSGNYSPAATSGYSSPAATSGIYSPAATSGYYSPAATSGESSPAATSGISSHAATSGYYSPAATSGIYSPAATSGIYSHAATSGIYSPAATSGYYSPAATSGNSSHAATSGDSSSAATSGYESIAAAIGQDATAKAALGNWIVLAEYKKDSREVLTVKTVKVDGKKIKANTFYKLSHGKFVAERGNP